MSVGEDADQYGSKLTKHCWRPVDGYQVSVPAKSRLQTRQILIALHC